MALFIWKDEYSVGIDSIDNQHKVLVSIINNLHSAMLSAKANTILDKILKELIDYTKTHFDNEENLFAEYGYPESGEHRRIHKQFTDKIFDLYDDFKNGKKMLSIELLNFLKDWLINHINGTDKKYSKFLTDKGVK
jgi:hemerythrin